MLELELALLMLMLLLGLRRPTDARQRLAELRPRRRAAHTRTRAHIAGTAGKDCC